MVPYQSDQLPAQQQMTFKKIPGLKQNKFFMKVQLIFFQHHSPKIRINVKKYTIDLFSYGR